MAALEAGIAIIGGGPGGYVAAIRAAQLGAKVVLIEERELGGTCLNRGCVPTKVLLTCADVLGQAKAGGEYGVRTEGVEFDLAAAMARKNQVVQRLRSGIAQLMKANSITVLAGRGRLRSPTTIAVRLNDGAEEEVRTRKVILASGSLPLRLPIPGCEGPGIWNTDDLWEMTHLPKRLLVIGGGAVGVEFADIFVRFGVEVTLVEMMPQLLPQAEADIARLLERALSGKGVRVYTNTTVKEIRHRDAGKEVVLTSADKEQATLVDVVLVGVGRKPATQDLGIEELNVRLKGRGVAVDEHMQTSVAGVYAIGDLTGEWMLAHAASREGEVAVEHALGHGTSRMSYKAMPSCVYTSPEIGTVGLTEAQATAQGFQVKKGRFPFAANAKALGLGETSGFVKIVADASTDEVLGVHIIGPHATDLIAEAALAIHLEVTSEELGLVTHPHPTLSEALMEAALAVGGRAIHVARA